MKRGPAARDLLGGLSRGLAVIEAFDATRPRASIADIARATGLTRAAARRCLLTLAELGYAEGDGRHYWLTPRVLRLGGAWLSSATLPELLQPQLDAVREATGESCSAAILDGTEVVYVARAAARRIMSISLGVGSRLPAHCTALGRALLSALPEGALEQHIAALTPEALTSHTRTSRAGIRAAIAEARAQGYALVDEELEIGLRSLAVPVRDQRGRCVAAINIGVQTARAPEPVLQERLLPALLAAAAELRRVIPG
ncbi:IclR family transcriptional regulator C-terminal domain-containing protein [Pseudoroseomonas cervicalis]|uniref:IclR family transcriptional regulator domain-containing protein n=1 Tax=Teichococcus cervicalis TaxID=204525 RepID=UPI00278B11A3|nr:IclR family transcriptional regulator C-terminal domain-containing protein [Pseudoroseomonas cervicalis]MDQ1080201.1 IclR family pca regulon transcriptional regulator [Pseudoroseomonas cervicalis]